MSEIPAADDLQLDRIRVLGGERFVGEPDESSEFDEPPEPRDPAQYVVDGLKRQKLETLLVLREYVDARVAYLLQERAKDEHPREVGGVAERIYTPDRRIETRYLDCGKERCDADPHGPYSYVVDASGPTYLAPISASKLARAMDLEIVDHWEWSDAPGHTEDRYVSGWRGV